MVRRKISAGDWLRGASQSIRSGQSMNPFATQRLINEVHDDRLQAAKDELFGTGGRGGNRNWEPPVYGTTARGKPVTVSFGIGRRANETLICDGHVDLQKFYTKAKFGKGHDHYLADGSIAGPDHGKFSG